MKAVDRGVELLDERLPGWRKAVDPEALDLSLTCGCVLGQVFGDYERGVDILDLTDTEARRFGFLRSRYASYARLTDAWKARLVKGSA